MTDLFEDVSADEFALPSDEKLIRRITRTEPAAEPAAYEEPAGEDTTAEAESERPRDEKGRFTKPETADEPAVDAEAAVDAQPNEPQPEPVDEALANVLVKFGIDPQTASPAEMKMAQSFREQEQLMGRQSWELGETRRALEERLEQIQQQIAQPQQPQAPQQVITQDLIESDTAMAMDLAYEQKNPAAIQAAWAYWWATDRAEARAWRAEKVAEERIAEAEQRVEARLAAIEGQVAPAAAQETERQRAALVSAAVASTPGLAEFVNSDKISEAAKSDPKLAEYIASGTPEEQAWAITTLYNAYRGRESDNLKVTQAEVARATAVQAQAARDEAFVASAATASTGEKPSKADQLAAEWDAMEAPYRDGWHI